MACYIYGCGNVGKSLCRLLQKKGEDVQGFIVSDDKDTPSSVMGIKIFRISNYEKTQKDQKIYIGVSDKYAKEIIEILSQKGINNIVYEHNLCKKLTREIWTFDTENILTEEEPRSRKFGFDRGEPIDRYYINRFLEETSKGLDVKSICEVADDSYSRKFFPNAESYKILQYQNGEDLTRTESLQKNSADVFICTQVLQVIYDVRAALYGAKYLLKENGTLLATVAGNISQISRVDYDDYGYFWGFTDMGIKKLMEEVFGQGNVEVRAFGNVASATAFIQGLAVEDLPDKSILEKNDFEYAICIGCKAVKK